MSSNTPNLGLLKKDPMTDGNETFNIQTMLNDNWDKIDDKVGQMSDELGNITIPDASLTVAGKTMLSNSITGTRENVAATEKAVKLALDKSLSSVPDASLTVAGKTMLSNAINGTRQNVAATEYAVKTAMESVKVENYDGTEGGTLLYRVPSQYPTIQAAIDAMPKYSVRPRVLYVDSGFVSNVVNDYDANFKGFWGGLIEFAGLDGVLPKLTGWGINIENCMCRFNIRSLEFTGATGGLWCAAPVHFYLYKLVKTVASNGNFLSFSQACRGGWNDVTCSNCTTAVASMYDNCVVTAGFTDGSNNGRFLDVNKSLVFIMSTSGPGVITRYSISNGLVIDSGGGHFS
uniref:tail fiber protein n=1 Tax=Paenibacillus terrae TaxID=159743 RepID=UPI0011A81148|nr:tail fiber protein [Paenibacillus terrae]